jgi:hypothetical protein
MLQKLQECNASSWNHTRCRSYSFPILAWAFLLCKGTPECIQHKIHGGHRKCFTCMGQIKKRSHQSNLVIDTSQHEYDINNCLGSSKSQPRAEPKTEICSPNQKLSVYGIGKSSVIHMLSCLRGRKAYQKKILLFGNKYKPVLTCFCLVLKISLFRS